VSKNLRRVLAATIQGASRLQRQSDLRAHGTNEGRRRRATPHQFRPSRERAARRACASDLAFLVGDAELDPVASSVSAPLMHRPRSVSPTAGGGASPTFAEDSGGIEPRVLWSDGARSCRSRRWPGRQSSGSQAPLIRTITYCAAKRTVAGSSPRACR
jgi:hypothetical protein